MVSLSLLIGGGSSFSVVFVCWSPSWFGLVRSFFVGGDVLVVCVRGVVSFWDGGSVYFFNAARREGVSSESSEEEESDEDK
jgi:hypothetical protein